MITYNTITDKINEIELLYLNLNCNRYCIKTGARLRQIPFNEVKELIKIHGEERAQIVLNQMQYSISPEWLLTDSNALQKLAIAQPKEYLIYALSALFIKPNAENTIELVEDCKVKIDANIFLSKLEFNLIANISELTRRLLATNRPIAIQEMIDTWSVKEVCGSFDNLIKYQLSVIACLEQISIGYYDDNIVNQRNRHKKELFAQQKRLIALTDLEKDLAISLPELDLPMSELKQLVLGNKEKQLKTIKEQKQIKIKSLNAKANINNHKNVFNGKFAGIKIK